MIRQRMVLILMVMTIGIGLSHRVLAQSDTAAPSSAGANGQGIRAATVLTVRGTVTAVEKAEKLVTIQEPDGRKLTLKVDNPYNLNAANVGDAVVMRYYEVVNVRKEKPGESLPSVSVNGGIVTAKAGGVPGATAEQQLSVVFSVVEVDKANGTVTIKGPDGSVETVKANDPKNLTQLKAGDDLVVTTSRATAISLDKAPAK